MVTTCTAEKLYLSLLHRSTSSVSWEVGQDQSLYKLREGLFLDSDISHKTIKAVVNLACRSLPGCIKPHISKLHTANLQLASDSLS